MCVCVYMCVYIRGVTVYVFVLNRISTDVMDRCVDLHGITLKKTGTQINECNAELPIKYNAVTFT